VSEGPRELVVNGVTWRVGDRFWTPHQGTVTIQGFRHRGPGYCNEARGSASWLPEQQSWQTFTGPHTRVAVGEPDLPSMWVQRGEPGQWVRHTKFGVVCVAKVDQTPEGRPLAHIVFAHPAGMKVIALGGGYLRPWIDPANAGSAPSDGASSS
jgi:hypothetical protein